MPRVLVIYFSKTGNTERMARAVADGASVEGVDVVCKPVQETSVDELLAADGVAIGSPTYYGTMAAEIKRFIDESVRHHRHLEGKVGAAFSSAGGPGGGAETTVLDIVKALLIHGMIVQGDSRGDHYGPTAVGRPDERSLKECQRCGQRLAHLVRRLATQKDTEA